MRTALALAITLALLSSPAHAQSATRPEDAYNAAAGLLARGLDDLAEREFRTFLEAHPRHDLAPDARYGLGVALARQGKHRDAADALTPLASREGFAFRGESALLAARAHLALSEPREAAQLLEAAIDENTSTKLAPTLAALLVESLQKSGESSEAIAAFGAHERQMDPAQRERATYFAALAEIDLGHARNAADRFARLGHGRTTIANHARLLHARTLHDLGSTKPAIDAYRHAKEWATDPVSLREASLGLAQALMDVEAFEEAQRELASINAKNDRTFAERLDLEAGRLAVLMQRPRDAVRALTSLTRSEDFPERDASAFWLARAHADLGQHREALAVLTDALAQHPESQLRPDLTYQLALAQGALAMHTEAIATLRTLAREARGTPLAGDALLAAAGFAQASGDHALAERLSSEAAQALEGDSAVDAKLIAAESAYAREDFASAAALYAELLPLIPADGKSRRPHVLSRLGFSLHRSGQTERAEAVFRELYTDPPTHAAHPAGLSLLAESAITDQNWTEAAAWLTRLTALGPETPGWDAAMLRLAHAHAQSGDRRAALAALEALLNQNPASEHSHRARYERGLLLLALDNPREAERAFEKAADASDPAIARAALEQLASLASASGDHANAAEYLARASRLTGAASPELALRQARALLAADDAQGALRALEALPASSVPANQRPEHAALLTLAAAQVGDHAKTIAASDLLVRMAASSLDPELLTGALYKRGRALLALDRPQDAERTFALALEVSPASPLTPSITLELAALASAASRHDEAASLCARLLAMNPTDPELVAQARYRLGVSLRALGDHARAAEALIPLAEQSPPHALSASAALLAGESLLADNKTSRAADFFERASTSTDPAIAPAALLRLGEAHLALQRWPRAEGAYTDFLSRFDADPRAHLARFGLAWACEQQLRYDEAIAHYRALVASHDGETAARAQFQIGECLFALKRHDEAATELLRVDLVYAYPAWSAAALYEAGRCFEALDRPEDARAQFEAVAARFPDTQWAELARRRLTLIATNTAPSPDAAPSGG